MNSTSGLPAETSGGWWFSMVGGTNGEPALTPTESKTAPGTVLREATTSFDARAR